MYIHAFGTKTTKAVDNGLNLWLYLLHNTVRARGAYLSYTRYGDFADAFLFVNTEMLRQLFLCGSLHTELEMRRRFQAV